LKQTRLLTIVLALVLVVALAYLMTDYARQQKRQAVFIDQIENSARSLSLLPTPQAGLEQQLADITAANARAQQTLSNNSLNSTAVIDSLLILADNCNLKVTPLTTQSWINKKVADSSYRALPLELQVEGSLGGLIDFVKMIDDSQKYPNLLISEMDIENDSVPSDNLGPAASPVTGQLSVTIVIRTPPNPEEPTE
jgi:Tfp pilus assembly protein PilO